MGVRGDTRTGVSPLRFRPGEGTASATKRRPNRRATLDEAFGLWFAGHFELCLDACDALTDTRRDTLAQVTLLRARALLRLDRAPETLRVLDAFAWHQRGDEAVTARMLTAQRSSGRTRWRAAWLRSTRCKTKRTTRTLRFSRRSRLTARSAISAVAR